MDPIHTNFETPESFWLSIVVLTIHRLTIAEQLASRRAACIKVNHAAIAWIASKFEQHKN